MSSGAQLKAEMAAQRERLLRAIAGVSEQQFKKRPEQGLEASQPWSIAEVLAHLLHTEQLWATRIEHALDTPESLIEPSGPAEHEDAARAGRSAPVPQLIHGLLAARRGFERLVDRADAEGGLERALMHPKRGRLTVEWMVETYGIRHEEEHSAQIEALRAALVPVEAMRSDQD